MNMNINSLTAFALFYCGLRLMDAKTLSTKPMDQMAMPSYEPEVTSKVHGIYGPGPIPYEEGELFEGDIAGISPKETTDKNVIIDPSKKWMTATIPYMIDVLKFVAADIQVIADAFQEFADHTCIRFAPMTIFKDRDFLLITALEGCWSYVGRRGGVQMISLENLGCVHRGIVVHELMHALGVWHEQSRHDRDDHVTINWANIAKKHRHNFQKRTVNESQTFDLNYDYGSVMHYSAYSFAVNRTVPTIVPKRKGVILGQRDGLSATDIAKINCLYECPKTIE